MSETLVIVGASLAGGGAAATLRQEGFDGRVVLIGAEQQPPYERPPLSKEYLRGEFPFERVLVQPSDFYDENGIETRFGVRATRVDAAEKVVELDGGERVAYDKLLVATGGRNRRFRIPGMDLEGIYSLRTVADSDRIRAEISPGRRAVVVGMGFIGSEVAASLRQSGVDVVVVDRNEVPLRRVLGEEVGRVIEGIHRDHGTSMIFEDTVAAFEGVGRVERVTTARGRRIECDFVVVGLGVEPVTDFLADTGAEIDNGVLVDEYLRTGVEGIYAAGDVANHYHPVFGRRIRVEHWQNALKQGPAAARNMLERGEPYVEIPWFWSDQYEHNLQYAGFHTEWDELVVRGSMEERNFVAFYRKDRRVLAAVAVNRGRDLRRSIPLIKAREPIDAARLCDLNIDLRELASVAGAR
ncbi:MAG TPA: FAD-dependent oxidoreductase [Rubrobacteraceae bacterium]|jgi:3-phenylpropionate/trans-cinnamate dioxygenase ferredoxin reductase subunit|nr:FAD-dependent oxidoreductase [Rubrobacteraceae bacterium]